MKRLVLLAAFLILANASGDSLTIGNVATGRNAYPFGGTSFGPGTRYQQAYSGSAFSSAGGPLVITGINFLNGSGSLGPNTYYLYLSTISTGIDALSNSNFDSNRGQDNALFTSVALSGAAPSTLTFSGTPFTYDPTHGNLLLDIVVSPGGGSANPFPAAYMSNTNAFGLFSRYHNFGFSNIGWGLVTRFDYVVPEPATVGIVVLGALLTACARNRLNCVFSRRN